MSSKNKWLLAIALIALGLIIAFTLRGSAHATTDYNCGDWQESCIPSVAPTIQPSQAPSIAPTLEVSPSAGVSATPTTTISIPASADNTSHGGSGVSDGHSSCPSCTAAPAVPTSAPSTGHAPY